MEIQLAFSLANTNGPDPLKLATVAYAFWTLIWNMMTAFGNVK